MLDLIKGGDRQVVKDLVRIRGGVYRQHARVVTAKRQGGECVYIVLLANNEIGEISA